NQREGWTGHLWQGRFFSYPMDQSYLLHAVRYIELNPVRAGLSARPEDYLWCSARARILGKKDQLITTTVFDDVRTRALLASATVAEEEADRFRAHERSGLPLGSSEFIQDLEKQLNTNLQRHKCGRPRKKLTHAGGESAEGNNRLHDEVRPSAGG
ncbi:MAG: transposase, partial [Thermoleophilia bacterium]